MKREKGITLISLVVTIIVLLILAGVTLTMLTGENGIMTRAKTAREQHIAGQELEENRLSGMENVMDQYLGAAGGGTGEAMKFTDNGAGDKNGDGKVDTWDEVTFEGYETEEFTVIKKEGTTLTLLAKYNLDTTKDETTGKWKQLSAAGGNCAFSSTNYWYTQGHWTSGTKTDLNNYETTYNETMPATETEENNAIKRARAYAGYFGATGRLLSWGEVTSGQTDYLFTNNTSVLSNCNFWLGSSYLYSYSYVYYANSGSVDNIYYDYANYYGVRPVLIVSDSLSQ